MSNPFAKLFKALRDSNSGKGDLCGPLSRKEVTELPRPSRIRSKEAVKKVRSLGKCEVPSCKNKDRFPALQVHHVQHVAAMGPDAEENLILTCIECHFRIHNGLVSDAELIAAISNRPNPKDKK